MNQNNLQIKMNFFSQISLKKYSINKYPAKSFVFTMLEFLTNIDIMYSSMPW